MSDDTTVAEEAIETQAAPEASTEEVPAAARRTSKLHRPSRRPVDRSAPRTPHPSSTSAT